MLQGRVIGRGEGLQVAGKGCRCDFESDIRLADVRRA
jgi:hypothetical protein